MPDGRIRNSENAASYTAQSKNFSQNLRERPWSDFVEAGTLETNNLLIVETGGTTGRPSSVAYTLEDFHLNFVKPFLESLGEAKESFEGPWLYAGPTGPHAIGYGADGCATALTGHSPYRVDLDTRWLQKLEQGIARDRYLNHVVEQCLDILAVRPVQVLFSTPPLLQLLGLAMAEGLRDAVQGIHWGGVLTKAEEISALKQLYPNAVLRSGFGNSLVGLFPEIGQHRGLPIYGHVGGSHGFDVVDEDGNPTAEGEEGCLAFSRHDSCAHFTRLRDRDRALSLVLEDGQLGFQPILNSKIHDATKKVIY